MKCSVHIYRKVADKEYLYSFCLLDPFSPFGRVECVTLPLLWACSKLDDCTRKFSCYLTWEKKEIY
ncbi:hypothetical protein JOB18_007629 [Solea senegalensis]|uniref:Uncharacterized protein n=1 Tax=Solea senegalensis TaxID=28829 RepID=A0AAV6QUE4_SOLSE|nr:hypothetical protein JOB18_007629 [Solea senegalensis]